MSNNISKSTKKFHFNPIKSTENSVTDNENDGSVNKDDDRNTKDNDNNESANDEGNNGADNVSNSGNIDNDGVNDGPRDNDSENYNEISEMGFSTRKYVLMIDNLNGCGGDIQMLIELFHDMGYEIEHSKNDGYEELKGKIENFKKLLHGDSAFIIFYGDGFTDYIITPDKYVIHMDNLRVQFNGKNCPNLRNSPKVFIMNICYFGGSVKELRCEVNNDNCDEDSTVDESCNDEITNDESSNDESSNDESNNNENTDDESSDDEAEHDILVLDVETERSICKEGSLITKALNDVIRENSSREKLINVMHSVSQRICELKKEKSQDYFCELTEIKFTSDLMINPIVKNNQIEDPLYIAEADTTGVTMTSTDSGVASSAASSLSIQMTDLQLESEASTSGIFLSRSNAKEKNEPNKEGSQVQDAHALFYTRNNSRSTYRPPRRGRFNRRNDPYSRDFGYRNYERSGKRVHKEDSLL